MNLCGLEHIIKENFNLSGVSSMKTGGCAKICFFPETYEELKRVLDETEGIPCRYIVGKASNLLFPDDASELTVIFTEKMSEIKKVSDREIYAMCGANLTSVCNFAKKNSLSGLEFAYGIPGSVGGGVYMNAGAYGGEMSQVLKSVEVYDTNKKEFYMIDASDCELSYRHSLFMQRKELVVTGAVFSLSEGDEKEIDAVCKGHMQARKDKQPLEYPSCGSAFKRPEGYFAGKLIEDCGLKGFSVGGAQISEKHAGFVINRDGATSEDVRTLLQKTADLVYEKFSVRLCPEIEIIEEPLK